MFPNYPIYNNNNNSSRNVHARNVMCEFMASCTIPRMTMHDKWMDILFHWKLLDVGNKTPTSNPNPDNKHCPKCTIHHHHKFKFKFKNQQHHQYPCRAPSHEHPPIITFHVTDTVYGRTVGDTAATCRFWIADATFFSSSDSFRMS